MLLQALLGVSGLLLLTFAAVAVASHVIRREVPLAVGAVILLPSSPSPVSLQ